FVALGNGTWALVQLTGGLLSGTTRALAVDNRSTANVWLAVDGTSGGFVARIPAVVPDGSQAVAQSGNVFATSHPTTVATGLVATGALWPINRGDSPLTHFAVAAAGTVTSPTAPDQVTLDDRPASADNACSHPQFSECKPHPDSNSDFTGYSFLTFTYPGID